MGALVWCCFGNLVGLIMEGALKVADCKWKVSERSESIRYMEFEEKNSKRVKM
jgi:hypothetical protein